MAWGWDESQEAHKTVYGGEHEAKLSHELLAGAASFEAFKLFEDHQRKEGKPVKHALAKEVLAGFVGAEVDKLIETKGLDEIDKIRAHEHAKKNAEQMYVDYYEKEHAAEEYDPERYPAPSRW